MLVAVLTLTAVASVQAADVKVEIKERDAEQNLVAAQNVKYSVSNSEGEIVADGETAEFALDVPEGHYELTVEQAQTEGRVRYGAAILVVPAEGDDFVFELTDAGLKLVEDDDDDAAVVIPNKPVANAVARPIATYPQLPQQAGYAVSSGRNWGFLGLAGALVATAVALGVDDDCPCPVTPVQR
ncbi:MAG: hypothetical protein IJE97_15695, partial [Thermoguttaceae bacterium]|nr:hypothetical protein [Thermoguttaceae bacterium]